MLTTPTILIVLAAIAGYSLLSRRLEASPVTLPMIFTGLGLLLGQLGLELVPPAIGDRVIHLVAELTLVVVLFADASRVRAGDLRARSGIPARMLLVGMPLTLLLGTGIAYAVFPEQTPALAFLTAAILTPTDAALGQVVVSGEAVPTRIAQSVSVESGLNDGLALPVVLVAAIAAAGSAAGGHVPDSLPLFAAEQVVLGPVAGIAIGFAFAKLLDVAVDRRTATDVAQGLYFLAVALIAYFGAELVGGNGFIAVFVAGFVFGNVLRAPAVFIEQFMEGEGQLLTLLTFLVFGAVLAPVGLEHANPRTLLVAVLFLTLVRMLPVWLSLAGTGLAAYDKLFLGWFGPRGLASILFALLVLERFEIPGADEMVACVVLTVLLSVVLHGVSAAPLSRRFGARGRGAASE